MSSVFVLASDLNFTGVARQLTLTLPALPRETIRLRLAVLGQRGAAWRELRAAGIEPEHLPIRHAFDVNGLRRLRQTVEAIRPDLLHAIGPRAVQLSALLPHERLMVSGTAATRGGLIGWLTDRQTCRGARVLAFSATEAARYHSRGVPADKLVTIPLAVAPPRPVDGAAFRKSLGLPATARIILAAGSLDRTAGLRDAVWAFDILKRESPDLYLVIVGDGPERGRLDAFGRALGFDDYRVVFAGERADLSDLFTTAEIAWVLHRDGGLNLALEAMAAGVPVLTWDTSDVAELVRDGASGCHVPHGDRVALASKTCGVLIDETLARRLGEGGRTIAAEHAIARAADQLAAAYTAR